MKLLILMLLCVFGLSSSTTTGAVVGAASDNSTIIQHVAWPPLPQTDITLKIGTTVLFVVSKDSGDHSVFSKKTPSGVMPFTSGLLNFNKNVTSFSYKFTALGDYVLMDLVTNNEMKLSIVSKQLNSSSASESLASSNSTSIEIGSNSNSTNSTEQITTTTTIVSSISEDLTETPTGAKNIAFSIYSNLSTILISMLLLSIAFLV